MIETLGMVSLWVWVDGVKCQWLCGGQVILQVVLKLRKLPQTPSNEGKECNADS